MNIKLIYLILILTLNVNCIQKKPTDKKTNALKTIDRSKENKASLSNFNETIWVIHQDKKSNYWFGSKENGVFYYNGQSLKNFTTKDGLVSNDIRGIQEDIYGNIYFDSGQGVSKYDGKTFSNLPIANPNSPSNNWILQSDDLWFMSDFNKNGVYRFDGNYLHYLKFPKSPQEDDFFRKNPNTSLKPYSLYTIYKDKKGYMWFGTSSLGFCRFDGKTISWHYEDQLQTTPEGGDFGTRAIFEDRDSNFWINNTRFRYNIESNSGIDLDYSKEKGIGYLNESNQLKFPFFQSITQDNDGNLWMVTYKNGVWKYNGKELVHYLVKDDESDILLLTIMKDNKGVLWLGSLNKGVYKFNGKSFEKQF